MYNARLFNNTRIFRTCTATFKALFDEAHAATNEYNNPLNSETKRQRALRRNSACVREVSRRTTNFYMACRAFEAAIQSSFGQEVTLRRAVVLITRPSQITYLKKADTGHDIGVILDFPWNALEEKGDRFFFRGLRQATTVREFFAALYDQHVGYTRMIEDPPRIEEIVVALWLARSVEDVAYIYKYHVHEDDLLTQVMVLDFWGTLVRTSRERRRLARVIRQAEQGRKGGWPIGWHASKLSKKEASPQEPTEVLIVSEPGEPVTD